MDFHGEAVFAEPCDGMLVESLLRTHHDFLVFLLAVVGKEFDGAAPVAIAVHDGTGGGEDEVPDVHSFGSILAEYTQLLLDIVQFVHHTDESPCADEWLLGVGCIGRHKGIEDVLAVL